MFNSTRDCVKNYFSSRKCFTFPQPVRDRENLKHLEHINQSELDPGFLVTSDQFVKHIRANLKCKKIEGIDVTGSGKYYVPKTKFQLFIVLLQGNFLLTY